MQGVMVREIVDWNFGDLSNLKWTNMYKRIKLYIIYTLPERKRLVMYLTPLWKNQHQPSIKKKTWWCQNANRTFGGIYRGVGFPLISLQSVRSPALEGFRRLVIWTTNIWSIEKWVQIQRVWICCSRGYIRIYKDVLCS